MTKVKKITGVKKVVKVKEPQLKLVYDVQSAPEKLGIANMIKILEQHRVVFWDSNKGIKPAFYGTENAEAKLFIVDTRNKEIDFEQYEREFNDNVFWEKELHNCKMSPIYFFTHYGTTTFPATDADTKKYLGSIGLKNIAVTDSAKARKAWDKQKLVVAEAMGKVTISFLKERKDVLDVLRVKYETKVLDLEKKIGNAVKLFDAKGAPLPDQKRIANLVGRIRQTSPVPEAWKEYRNKKRKWDGPMLFTTNYDKLLEMYNDLHKVSDSAS